MVVFIYQQESKQY